MAEGVEAAVREVLAVIPAGCTWLLPVEADGEIVDFRIGAVSGRSQDIYGRGGSRVGARLSELYPSMVGGPLWQVYMRVVRTGAPDGTPDFHYADRAAGIVAEAEFDVAVHPVLGGLLVWWQRLDEDRRRLELTELIGGLGWAEYDLISGRSDWSPGMFRLFERDPMLGPMTRAEQAAALVVEDHGLSETAWQTLDSGGSSDVTVRFQTGEQIKYLRVRSDVARDAEGSPLKIYAVVQDVTTRIGTRSAIEELSDQLRTREMTALAEHRLAGQLQNLIQPVPREPFTLAGLEVAVRYLPAESTTQVGGDWYHAQTLADGQTALAVGDVVGHGLEAASGMAHLRFALVAWLSMGVRDPGVLLAHMNQLCGQLRITGTAAIAVYDPATRTLRWARAGHMPPLLARAGDTQELGWPAGLLLGAADDSVYPVVAPVLHRDDLVLFYTDGLVERRGASSDVLLEQVQRVLSVASVSPDVDTLAGLRDQLSWASPDDDTCTVAIRVH